MEEKKRYEKIYFDNKTSFKIIDNITEQNVGGIDNIIRLLNQQDKRIKELREESKELEIKLDKCGTELVNAESLVSYLGNENQQLKQQLHDLPKKIVGEIRDVAGEYWDFNICKECGNVPVLNALTTKDFEKILDTILNKYGDIEK